MGSVLACYHHSHCEDRPAVATCSECGKGLCTECADRLRSPNTGEILCVDCLNSELEAMVIVAGEAKKKTIKELIMMGVGFVIGLIVGIILSQFVPVIGFFMPTLFASFGTIWQMTRGYGFFVGLLFFIALMFASPIMFIVRLVVRIRDVVALKKFAASQIQYHNANDKYFKVARSMTSQKIDAEAIRRDLEVQYAALRQNDQAEYEKKVADGVASRLAEVEKEIKEMKEKEAQALAEREATMQKVAGAYGGVEKANKNLGKKTTHDRETVEV